MSTMLEVNGLNHRYGGGEGAHVAVNDLSFTVETGQLACIVGPSGCGKSTLLRCISGLITPTGGEVKLHGDKVDGVPEDLAVVFQDYSRSLFPWLSVRQNVEFPLRWKKMSRAERKERALEALEWVGLPGVSNKYPWQLSGGMQQRVSIARALARRPALLLMDEPFASVDAQTRFDLEDLLRQVQLRNGSTILLVTHDIDESVYLGDRVLVLSKSPASIVADLPVDLPPEREQISTRESFAFVTMRSEVARLLHSPPGSSAASAVSGVAASTVSASAEASAAAADIAESEAAEKAESSSEAAVGENDNETRTEASNSH
ncbi:ABC transporter [Prauserella marina]|uniref:NitT/TauT family transport system ATP-binding protein n=1 Tax=Prauserella marina TaxID=530584 RepID=A0A222VWB5_9PSEU|nr:ABC transporter ATP-binding protein [Prauserella marina]ASR38229.1 ABC transporter [Prauserella marina]PWV78579.1 NitT/TauT family transport system ATP-binding protein [Prauserella marina]SDC89224.1 NitT/TauT family transport system ATP-binding protein [Prauserella marina]